MQIDVSGLQMSESAWEKVGMDMSGWVWVEVSGSGYEWYESIRYSCFI